ncbi:cytochrome c oxidase assembly protein COX11, mitochondrial isoform X2 [Phymastichus coffea]|uniref:cytochrome c oxidase assembly protein COX11, mitochondrial isoform X2 n=1 Tax=Phymastichus coffea TaxID=108790 RepID=UPI00273B5841|nr:cytochrome c oxidase assembly protein COX11, mitochondrial isoform X2 [Phymastichus coffea]
MFIRTFSLTINSHIRRISTNLNHQRFNQVPPQDPALKEKLKTTFNYVTAIGILAVGLTYAAVPLYRIFCQAFGYGGTTGHDTSKISDMKPIKHRVLKIKFNADTAAQMAWNFQPQQKEIKVVPGQYFNKIQCFCFEEQRLEPNEQVDMPVFFFVDPDFSEDPKMEMVNELVLSYTFFEAKEGSKLPIPSYIKKLH